MKYNWDNFNDDTKRLAVKREMELVTHNGTTKDDFVNIMRFQQQEIERLEEFSGCGCGLCLAHNNMKCPKMPAEKTQESVTTWITTQLDETEGGLSDGMETHK